MGEYYCRKINMSVTPEMTASGRIVIPDCEHYNLPDVGEFKYPCDYASKKFKKCRPAGLERKAQEKSKLLIK